MVTNETLFPDYGEVVTVPELAKMLRVGRNTAYDLVGTGKVRSVKVGKQIRIPKLCVMDFLQRGQQEPGE